MGTGQPTYPVNLSDTDKVVSTSAGVADAGKLIKTNSEGKVDDTFTSLKLPAYRNLTAGDILKVINDSGVAKVDKVQGFAGSAAVSISTSGGDDFASHIIEISNNKYFLLFAIQSGSADRVRSVVVSVSGTTVSLGSDVGGIPASGSFEIGGVDIAKLATDKVIITWKQSATTPVSTQYAVVATVSGTTITFGTPALVENTANNLSEQLTSQTSTLTLLETDKVLLIFKGRDGSSWVPRAVILTISGTGITVNAIATLTTGYNGYDALATAMLSSTKVICLVGDGGNQTVAFVVSISGTTVTHNANVSLNAFGAGSLDIFAISDSLAVCVYQSTGATTTLYYNLVSISGTTPSNSFSANITSAVSADRGLNVYASNNLIYIYSPYDAKIWKFQLSGLFMYLIDTYTLTFASSHATTAVVSKKMLCYDTANKRLAFFRSAGNGTTDGITAQFGYPDYDEFITLSEDTYLADANVPIKDVVGGQSGLITGNYYGITYAGAIAHFLGTGSYQKIGMAKSATEMFIDKVV